MLDDEDPDFIYCDPDNSELIYCPVNEAYEKNTYNRLVETGLSLEKNLLAYSDKIKAVDYLRISCSKGPDIMINSKGLRVFKDSDIISIIAGCRAEEGDIVKEENSGTAKILIFSMRKHSSKDWHLSYCRNLRLSLYLPDLMRP